MDFAEHGDHSFGQEAGYFAFLWFVIQSNVFILTLDTTTKFVILTFTVTKPLLKR